MNDAAEKIGRIAVKLRGGDKGKKVVIVGVAEPNVWVTGPKSISGAKRKLATLHHLQLTDRAIAIPPDASDAVVERALTDAGLLELMRERRSIPRRLSRPEAAAWEEARRLCQLSPETEAMALRLGMKPRDLMKNRPTPAEAWKAPVNDWIRGLYFERFGTMDDQKS